MLGSISTYLLGLKTRKAAALDNIPPHLKDIH